jgi:hypothetical protein
VSVLGRNLASVTVKTSHLIEFIMKRYKFYNFNVVCKVDTAIKYITFKHRKGLFPLTFTGGNNTYRSKLYS